LHLTGCTSSQTAVSPHTGNWHCAIVCAAEAAHADLTVQMRGTLTETAQEFSAAALATLVEIMRDKGASASARVRFVLDRAHCKSPSPCREDRGRVNGRSMPGRMNSRRSSSSSVRWPLPCPGSCCAPNRAVARSRVRSHRHDAVAASVAAVAWSALSWQTFRSPRP
jgi:hypothetical protein